MPEKEIIASTGVLATIFTLVMGLLYRIQNRRIVEVREEVKECVTDKVSLERFAHVGEKVDDVKTNVEELRGVVTEIRDISIQTQTLVEERSRRRD
jgi:methyl-accepting chemotaxis protein